MNMFRHNFLRVLTEQDDADIGLGDENAEAQAIANELEPSTSPETLEIPDNPELALRKQQNARTTQTLQTWIDEIGNFIEYINGTTQGSINYALNAADCDSLMTDVQRSESKKISRLAQDLSSLEESLKQYLLLAKRKQDDAGSI